MRDPPCRTRPLHPNFLKLPDLYRRKEKIMLRAGTLKMARQLLIMSILIGCLCLTLAQPNLTVLADTCTDSCDNEYYTCTSYCDSQANDCWNWGGWNCDTDRWNCYNSCDEQHNSCLNNCTGSGGGGGTSTSDGHIFCDGWDRQGECYLNLLSAAGGSWERAVTEGSHSSPGLRLKWMGSDVSPSRTETSGSCQTRRWRDKSRSIAGVRRKASTD